MSLKRQVTLNLASNYVMTAVGMTLGFIVVPFLIHKLGKEAFGIVAMVESLVILFEVVTVSVRQALSRHATFALSQGRTRDFEDYLSTGRLILFGSSAIVMTIGTLVSLFFTHFFRVPAGQEAHAQRLFFLISLGFAAAIPNAVYWAVLYAKQRFDLINTASSVGIVARAALILGWFSTVPSGWATLTAYGLISCGVTFADNLTVYLFHKKVYPGLRIRPAAFRREYVREIVSYSVHTSLSRLSTTIVGSAIHICMNVFWGPATNAVYSVSQKLPTILRKIFVEPIWTLTPSFTKLVAEGDTVRVERMFLSFSKMLTIVIMPIGIAILAFGQELIALWVGPGFEESADLMKIYVAPLLVGIPAAVCGCLNSAYGKVKVPSLVGLTASVVNVVVGMSVATIGGLKLFGFAWTNLFMALIYIVGFGIWYACRISGISVRKYLLESLLKPCALASVLWGCYFWLAPREVESSAILVGFGAAGLAVTAVYVLACHVWVLSDAERRQVKSLVTEVVSKFPFRRQEADNAS